MDNAINNVMELPSAGALFFRILLSLLLIVAVIYIILKIINQQQKLRDNQKKWVKVLDYQPLGPNRGLYLMEIYDLTCIMAITDGQISILKEIDINTKKWEEIKDNLQQIEDILPSGLGKIFRSKFPFRKSSEKTKETSFKQQLAEQFRKSQYLSQEITKGRDRDE